MRPWPVACGPGYLAPFGSYFGVWPQLTDAMMTAAAAAVGDAATIRHDPHGTLLPDRAQLADIATVVASAVAKAAVADAVAPALTDDQIDQAIHRIRWLPRY